MFSLSSLRTPAVASVRLVLKRSSKPLCQNTNPARSMGGGGGKMAVVSSKWTWEMAKDDWMYFLLIGALPWSLLATYCNVRHGPAVLKETPEGYVPYNYEYEKHPVRRFMMRYFPYWDSYELKYERTAYYIKMHEETMKAKQLQMKTAYFAKRRQDASDYYYVPKSTAEELFSKAGGEYDRDLPPKGINRWGK